MNNGEQHFLWILLVLCCVVLVGLTVLHLRLRHLAADLAKQLQAAQSEASKAGQLLADVAGASPLAIYASVMYPDGGSSFTFISPRTREVIGVSPEGIRADPARRLRFILEEDQARIMALRAKNQRIVEATGVSPPFEIEVQAEFDGRRSWVRIASMLLRVEPDKSSIWIGYFEDISQRKKAELETQLVAKQQQSILDGATAGITFVRDGIILRNNRVFDDLHGARHGSLIGTYTAALYVDPTLTVQNKETMMRTLQSGDTWQAEAAMRRSDGSEFWARVSGRAIESSDMSEGSVWMLQDVTAERQARATLLEAKELAEESTRAKSDFLANMSHEIRTPMNAIIGMSQLALNLPLDDAARNYVAKAHRAAQNLLGIINDILDFSKIDAGKLDIEQLDFSLEDVFEQLTILLTEKVQSKPIELVFSLPMDMPLALRGDPLRLGQVLINLANNAVKFTAHGTARYR
jgi:PAS domain S-box-containing protein